MMRTLRSRILLSYVGFAVAVAVVFGLATAVFLYSVEDAFFEQLLADEAVPVEAAFARTGVWGAPRFEWMAVYTTMASLPADLREPMQREPRQREFAGRAGRHYHVHPLRVQYAAPSGPAVAAPRAWLVAEVQGQLVLRPLRSKLLMKWLSVELVILAMAAGLAVLVSRRVARPLSELAASVRALDPASPTPVHRPARDDAEIAVVASALDDLQERVAGFVAREQAFTRDVSHELRTPLAIMRTTAERLVAGGELSPDARRGLSRVLGACERLEWTIRTLLELARERPVASPRAVTVVRPVFEEVVLELEEPLRVRELRVVRTVPSAFTLPVERDVLRLVLGNVLGNACAHAAPGEVRVWSDGVGLLVTNQVYPASLPERLGTVGARRDDSPGYGFGLELSRRLCERSGLSLGWRTRGDTFEVRLG
jgi:signal transduction histidine kinase